MRFLDRLFGRRVEEDRVMVSTSGRPWPDPQDFPVCMVCGCYYKPWLPTGICKSAECESTLAKRKQEKREKEAAAEWAIENLALVFELRNKPRWTPPTSLLGSQEPYVCECCGEPEQLHGDAPLRWCPPARPKEAGK